MGLGSFLASKKGKIIMGFVYGWGAAIVIVGALFKIQHWPGAGPMLVVGLSTEAVIFLISAFEPVHMDLDWSLVYPELAHHDDEEEYHVAELEEGEETAVAEIEDKGTITEQLDNLLEESKIGPELIASLGDGLRNLSESTHKLSDISDATTATNEYVDNVRSASQRVGSLADSYEKAAESLAGVATSAEDGANYGEQLQRVTTNLSQLNEVYETQLRGLSDQASVTGQMYDRMGELVSNLEESIDDTKSYKDNIGALAKNLGALNTVYGNMLSAMNFNSQQG
jgi:gliding motility-associated protein GldL